MWCVLLGSEEKIRPRLTWNDYGAARALTLTASMPQKCREERRVNRALTELYRAGVRRTVDLGLGLPRPLLAACGLKPIDTAPLRQAYLPALLTLQAHRWHIPLQSACVRLSAPQSDPAVWKAAGTIVRSCRYIALDTGRGQEKLECWLCRTCGVAPGGRAVLEVTFSDAPRGDVPALCLGPEGSGRQPIFWQGRDEELFPESLAAALWQDGVLAPGDVRPLGVEDYT